MPFYSVELFDEDDTEITSDYEINSLREAKSRARSMVNDPEYPEAYKAEVLDDDGVCVFDCFRRPPTLAQLKKAAEELGCTVRKHDGEFRVNLIGGTETQAYYTNDANDALGTMRAMRSRADANQSAILPVGTRVLSIKGECDHDADADALRETGPNAIGTIDHFGQLSDGHYGVNFENGTSVLITPEELADPTKYKILHN